jgi:ribonuclease J
MYEKMLHFLFPYIVEERGIEDKEGLMEEARHVVEDAITDCMDKHVSDWGKIKNVIKDSLSDFLWKRTKRSPMILPIIMEV